MQKSSTIFDQNEIFIAKYALLCYQFLFLFLPKPANGNLRIFHFLQPWEQGGRNWGGGGISIFILLKNVPALQISNWASPLPAMHFSFLPGHGLFLFGGGDPRLALLDKHHLIVNKVQRGSNRTHFQEWKGWFCFWTSQYILLSFIWLVNS